ncbi:MAG TPA: endonuclease/exonuclease/phosphatase family protein [Oligoflexia bacterium]|nr:endonuclease/exonuclease/phosphatase family protein [Oligoflexia bacterium]HMR24570.1 endonuclease/exonuclease/phosphatase family protein [Oligoflexia bacterium]
MLKQKKISLSTSFILCFFLLFCACKNQLLKTQHHNSNKKTNLFIMTYNVENLFDIKDDPKKDDETFLPYALKKNKKHHAHCAKIRNYKWKKQCFDLNWDKIAYETKLKNIAHVIALQNKNNGPDILFLQEIENINVLQDLNQLLPKKVQFQSISLIEGQDTRGIDVAIMSKLPLKQAPQLFHIPFDNISNERKKDTRGILHAQYTLPDGKSLGTYSIHFPAPYHPKQLRQQALTFLNQLQKKHQHLDYHIAAGDFNVSREESDKTLIFQKIAQKQWLTPHLSAKAYVNKSNVGSNYYAKKKSWSFLDVILLSQNFTDNQQWEYTNDSFHILNNAFIMQDQSNKPKSYNFVSKQGVSDHFPVALNIELQ